MRRLICSLTLAVVALAGPAVRGQDLPPDLAAVPGEAIGFLHVRAAELWKSDALKGLRVSFMKAGPAALKALDDRFVPAPSTIDRVTVVVLNPQGGAINGPPLVAVVSFSAPFDRARAAKSLLPNGQEMKAGDKTFVADGEFDLALRVIDDRTLAIAPTEAMKLFLEGKAKGERPFAAALKQAASRHHLVLALNSSLLPGEAVAQLPEPLQPLARAKSVHVTVDIGKEVRADLRLQFGDEAQAKSGEAAARDGTKMARDGLKELRAKFAEQLSPKGKKGPSPLVELPEAALAVAALGAVESLDEYLRDLPVKREGNALALSVSVPAEPFAALLGMSGLSAGFVLPAAAEARGAAMRTKSANNLKQIALAMHNYHDTYNHLPQAAIIDKNGKPLLSWRVAILPFIEQDNLYKQFKLDEPWDSEHNKKLLARMPPVYALPNVTKPGDVKTHYRVFYGNGAAFDLKKGLRFQDFTDGTSNTILVVEAADPVEWTKPDDLAYDPNKPLPKLGRLSPDGFWVALADGSVHYVRKKVSEQTLRGFITRNGNELPGNDFLDGKK